MQVEEMVEQLSTLGRRKSPKELWETSLYYFGSIMLNKFNMRKKIGTKEHIRYYSIFFGASALGKDFSISKTKKLFNLDKYGETMLSMFEKSCQRIHRDEDEYDELVRYMPKSPTINVEGTSEGLFQVAQSQLASGFGSLNLYSSEYTDTIISSSGLIARLKQLYDSEFQAKIIKGSAEGRNAELKKDLEGVICNFIGLGSKKSITAEAAKELKRVATSGLYRRTFIIDSKAKVEKNTEEDNVDELRSYLEALNEHHKQIAATEYENENWFYNRFFEYTNDLYERLEEIDDELIQRAHNDQLNEFAQYNTGSLEMIIDLAHIIAFLEWDHIVDKKHIDKAYDFFKRTRDSVEDTFKSVHPYKVMYDLLKLKSDMTISEMAEYEHTIPIAATKVKDNIALLEELCYRRDEVLVKSEGKVTRYKIEPLPRTTLDDIIVSVDTEHKGKFAINYTPLVVSFFGEDKPSIERLVVSENIDSFCACHFEPSEKAPDGHRKASHFIEGENIIVLDIDDGMTLEEAQEILHEYTYIIYTTASHREDHHKFRIIIPTKQKFFVTVEQHKKLYENVTKVLDINISDVATYNAGRLFFTQRGKDRGKEPEGEMVLLKNKGELLDISCCIPSTDRSDTFMPIVEEVAEMEDEGRINRREAGMIKWALMNYTEGARNTTLYRLAAFLRDIDSDNIEGKIRYFMNMTSSPLPENEVNTILRSLNINT